MTGPRAVEADFTDVLASKMPLFIGIVVLLSALLLLAGVPLAWSSRSRPR